MKKVFFLTALYALVLSFLGCGKQADYYYAKYLNDGEVALPGKVDSLQILPGNNRAILKFKVTPDRRVTKFKISYRTALSSEVMSTFTNVNEGDYGNYKEVELNNLPEATLFANVIGFNSKNDSSNTEQAVEKIYGERYQSVLGNRIFSRVATESGKKRIIFLKEESRPSNPNIVIFYPLQNTIVTYPLATGGTKTVELSLYKDFVEAPDIAISGTITHYSNYKPVENAIDIFKSNEVSITF